ncbi:MAG: cysteine desulfurase [Methylobacteriaceae bacterium]|nr:cysteine desulfurase [Methylobacteriaceae bacterium]
MIVARAYLDHNATAPLRPEVARCVADAMAEWGNPSSVHGEGRRARERVEEARDAVAALVGARPADVLFTSGGTEANATALRPGALARDGSGATRLLVGATDHASALAGHGFGDAAEMLPVDREGRVDLAALDAALARGGGAVTLVSLALANSETGVLQDAPAIAERVRAGGGLLHLDAVQAAGRLPVSFAELGADALSLSAHKLGGPLGAGALVLAPGRAGPNLPLIRGGSQEHRRRAGTENGPAIAGFGLAARLAGRGLAAERERLAGLRAAAEREIRRIAPDAVVFGDGAPRLPNTLAFAVPGLPAETALIALDLDGVAVSSGSACSSGKVGRSHVLAAMGVAPELAAGMIRVSVGWSSRNEDVSRFARAFEKLVRRLYERGRAKAA